MNRQRIHVVLTSLLPAALVVANLTHVAAAEESQAGRTENSTTVLAAMGSQFTLDGKPTFLLGISYYGGAGAPEQFVEQDLDDLRRSGFNWLRVWATWSAFEQDVSAVDGSGRAREPYLTNLTRLVSQCDRRAMVVDVTLTRGPLSRNAAEASGLTSFEAHRQAVVTLINALSAHRNWYLDLANEHDVRDDRYVSASELHQLRALVRQMDPKRLVTASFGGHDLSVAEIREAVTDIGVDFLAIHRPRNADSPGETESVTRRYLANLREMGKVIPVHYQEPFRRGYTNWEPSVDDYLTDLRGARASGAAGWCLHNGQQRKAPHEQPRRSFDLRERRLFDQLDEVELNVIQQIAKSPGK